MSISNRLFKLASEYNRICHASYEENLQINENEIFSKIKDITFEVGAKKEGYGCYSW